MSLTHKINNLANLRTKLDQLILINHLTQLITLDSRRWLCTWQGLPALERRNWPFQRMIPLRFWSIPSFWSLPHQPFAPFPAGLFPASRNRCGRGGHKFQGHSEKAIKCQNFGTCGHLLDTLLGRPRRGALLAWPGGKKTGRIRWPWRCWIPFQSLINIMSRCGAGIWNATHVSFWRFCCFDSRERLGDFESFLKCSVRFAWSNS